MYDKTYYDRYANVGYGFKQPWPGFFGHIAAQLSRELRPLSVLDAGCAFNVLAWSFEKLGVPAQGFDGSAYAISQARGTAVVHDITEPFPGKADLVTCIEVLEHVADAERAVNNLCRAADRWVLFSSTPDAGDDSSHINCKSQDEWAAIFERNGFRRTQVDVSYVCPWAMLLERVGETPAPRQINASPI